MSDLRRFQPYLGDDVAPRLASRCGAESWSGGSCDRSEGHSGEHVEVSGIGLVLDVWGSEDSNGGIDNRTRAAIEELADIEQMLASAMDEVECRLNEMSREYGDDPVLAELINSADVPTFFGGIGLTDDESAWPAEIAAIRARVERRKKSAA